MSRRLAMVRGAFLLVLLVVFSTAAIALDKDDFDPEKRQYEGLLRVYEPLHECVEQKLAGIDRKQRAEMIVASGAFDALDTAGRGRFGPWNDWFERATDDSVDRVERALLWLGALATYKSSEPEPERYLYREGRISVWLDADVILAGLPTVACSKPEGLEHWVNESLFQDIYINLVTEYPSFGSCVDEQIDGGLNLDRALRGLLKKGYGGDLRDDLLTFVKPAKVDGSTAGDEQLSVAYLNRLISHATQFMLANQPNHSFRLRLRRLAAAVSIKLAIAGGDDLECEPSNGLLYWLDKARHANP